MSEHKYTAAQLQETAGISTVTYAQWKARGFIKSEYKAKGSGNPQMYSFAEVFRVTVLARLVGLGISVGVASMHVDHLYGFKRDKAYLLVRRYPQMPADRADLGEDSGTSGAILKEADILVAVRKFEAAAIVSLDGVEAHIKETLPE
jgi:hypothetical protein